MARPESPALHITRQFTFPTVGFLLLICLSVALTIATPESQRPLRILVTNDDGVESTGIQTLAEALRAIADVVVIAPDGNQSGSSHASAGGPLSVREHRDGDQFFGYGVSGFPADAVRFGLLELGRTRGFDLVVSGINQGANVGDVAHLSGTVGAAMEAVYLGVPAIAVSQETGLINYQVSAAFTVSLVEQWTRRSMPERVVLSVNVPSDVASEIVGVAAVPMGGSYLRTAGYERQDNTQGIPGLYRARRERHSDFSPDTDSHAYDEGFITVTPLRFDWTAEAMLATIDGWRLAVPR